MPAASLTASHDRDHRLRLVAVGLVALLLASLSVVWAGPTTARDWTPRIKAARQSQIYWEAAMRAADADVRRQQRAIRQARASLKRSKARLQVAHHRRTRTRAVLAEARSDLRHARRQAQRVTFDVAGATEPPPSVSVVTPALALRLAGIDGVTGLAAPLLPNPVVPPRPAADPGHASALAAVRREVQLLEKRALKQGRNLQRTRQKEQRAWRSVRQARTRVATALAAKRAAVARRESAERSLGSWILAMETYARGRAANMSRYRPGIDSPFAWPARGRISQSYSRSHDGLDIVSYRGAPIRAAAFGVIAYIGWNPWDEHGRAFMVVIAHAGGLETLYGHILPRRSVRIGQAVRKGQVIGYMGNTGNSTGTHLHFEVRRGRTTVNPLGYL